MAKYEKEVKVLNINIEDIQEQLKKLKAEFIEKTNQKIYVYDIPTIYCRFIEIKSLINIDNELVVNTSMKKFETLLIEIYDLLSDAEITFIEKILGFKFQDINNLTKHELQKLLKNEELDNFLKNYEINPNKWIRLRKTNDKIELTCKHVFDKKRKDYQSVLETEINVSDFEEANRLLESVGIAKRSYQEKIRYSYKYKNAEIEIDIWPMLEPYLEIESENSETINEILKELNLNKNYEIVSLNTEQLYKAKGIDIHKISELKFKEK